MSSIRVAQESARGTFVLFVGNLLYTAILAVGTIVIARLLGPGDYGLYTLVFVLPGLVTQFVGFGVGAAITRYVPLYLSKGEPERARSVTRTATIFLLLFGTALSGVNFLVAPYFVATFLHRPEIVSYVQMSSLWVLGVALTACIQSSFVGWASMGVASGFNVFLGVLKLVVSVGLILVGFGVYGAVLGHVAAYVVEGGVGVVALYVLKMRPKIQGPGVFLGDIGSMVRYGFPIFAAQVASGFSTQYAMIVLASIAVNVVVGYYSAAINVTVAITTLSGALAMSLFRSFAALDGLKEDVTLAFAYSVKYSSYILTPLAFFLLASASPIVYLLYGSSYASSVVLLEIAALSFLPIAVGWLVLPSFFNGVGASRLTLFVSIVAAVLLGGGSYLLGAVLGLGADGIMLALVASNSGMTIAGLILSRRLLGTRLPSGPLLGIFVAAAIAGLAVWLLPVFGLSSVERLIVDALVYLCLYATLAPLSFGVNIDDLVRLSIAVETLGLMRKPFGWFLTYERLILRLKSGRLRMTDSGDSQHGEESAGERGDGS